MRAPSLFLALLLPIFLSAGCDRDSTAPLEVGPDQWQASGPSATQSRVFDGRDSVATGIDGLTATQTNFTIVTEFVRIRDVVERNGGERSFTFVEITDPDNLDPETPLFESRENNPIDGSDDTQVTWGEFSGAEGAVIVKCTEQGTHSVTHLSGLIPKGVYSAWIDVFEVGSGTGDLDHRIGRFEYAEIDEKGKSKGNVFRASDQGEGHIAGFVQPRVLDEGGDNEVKISGCMLEDVENELYDWRVLGIYHIDGTPGVDEDEDAGTFVEQVGFAFETEADDGPIVE